MSDERKTSRSLSEISHLFLSDVRARHTNGAAPPRRTPPQEVPPPQPDISMDLTPDEYAATFGIDPVMPGERPRRPVSAVIATCADTQHPDQHRAYGRHLAAEGERIGLIEIESTQVRITYLDSSQATDAESASTEDITPARLRETLEELNADVDQWLIALAHPRAHEARQLLSLIDEWAVLCRCDHESVVACYRTLKGLITEKRPQLTLAMVDAGDEAEAGRVFQKLSSVCEQFLKLPLKLGVMVHPQEAAEHVITCWWGSSAGGEGPSESPWQIVRELLLAKPVQRISLPIIESPPIPERRPEMHEMKSMNPPQTISEPMDAAQSLQPAKPQANEGAAMQIANDGASDVIELPASANSTDAILSAVLQQNGGSVIECPVRPPMCGASRLGVDREHRLVLLAATRRGLEDLRTIGQAYRWLIENRGLVAMAMPQFQIDAHQLPRLRLLVDQRDLSAELLQPMLQSGHVTVESYRKLRWGGRTGLLLEAA